MTKGRTVAGPLTLRTTIEQWPLIRAFRITGYKFEVIEVLVVSLESEGHIGRGEAAGVYYRAETADLMRRQIEGLRSAIEKGIDREGVQNLLAPGGARNALDCALWDLDAKLTGRPAWEMVGLGPPQCVLTTFTCGAEEPEAMAAAAREYGQARAIKLKLTGEPVDADRVRAVRGARPDVWLSVDANQGFDLASLDRLMPVLVDAKTALIEQPFPVGQEQLLDHIQSDIPIAADESMQQLSDLHALEGRFDVVNIKLDKCGGFTEGLAIAEAARQFGLQVMVGNMMGTSLAMAPAFLLGQLCSVVDLDGPVLLKSDRPARVQYSDGYVSCPSGIWGW